MAGDRLHGAGRAGRRGLGAVVEEQRAQGFIDAAVVTGQPVAASGILRWGVEDAEVEQHLVCGIDQRPVVAPTAAVAFGLRMAAERRG
jgi:hypothetical protein